MTIELTPRENVTVEELPAEEYATTTLTVDFLYLDLETCERCRGTERALDAALEEIAGVLETLSVEVAVRKIHVADEAAARRTELEVSPTVRIDGRDVQPEYTTSACDCRPGGDCCGDGDRSDDTPVVSCRDWRYRGETHSRPPVALLLEELLRAALAERESADGHDVTDQYRLPENLQRFFEDSSDGSLESADDGSARDEDSYC